MSGPLTGPPLNKHSCYLITSESEVAVREHTVSKYCTLIISGPLTLSVHCEGLINDLISTNSPNLCVRNTYIVQWILYQSHTNIDIGLVLLYLKSAPPQRNLPNACALLTSSSTSSCMNWHSPVTCFWYTSPVCGETNCGRRQRSHIRYAFKVKVKQDPKVVLLLAFHCIISTTFVHFLHLVKWSRCMGVKSKIGVLLNSSQIEFLT